ncbi:hypothetical protein [Clostridium polynesiense]|uniref:hypothetical protein n=1 Tax=Clostridium polynesiense TaxID=1325933 RepID=UPI00058F3ED0|nr:hypothetical protein [Clostridium polynesiense]
MKINFTRSQFKALMELMLLNLQLLRECEPEKYKEYSSLIHYILSYEDLHNALSEDSYEDDSIKDSEINKAKELKREYDEAAFWKELSKRLAASNLYEDEMCIDLNNYEEYEKKKANLEHIYFKKFKAMEYSINVEGKEIK